MHPCNFLCISKFVSNTFTQLCFYLCVYIYIYVDSLIHGNTLKSAELTLIIIYIVFARTGDHDYKLVFMSSDSSSQDDINEGSDINEYEWDYYESCKAPNFSQTSCISTPFLRGDVSESSLSASDTDEESLSYLYIHRTKKENHRKNTCRHLKFLDYVIILISDKNFLIKSCPQKSKKYGMKNSWIQPLICDSAATLIRQPHDECSSEFFTYATAEQKSTILNEKQPFRNNDVYIKRQCTEKLDTNNTGSTGLTIKQNTLISKMSTVDIVDNNVVDYICDDAKNLNDIDDKNVSDSESNQVLKNVSFITKQKFECTKSKKRMDPINSFDISDSSMGYLVSENLFESSSASQSDYETSTNGSYDIYSSDYKSVNIVEPLRCSEQEISGEDSDSSYKANKKQKRFKRVYYVNHNTDDSSNDASDSSNNETDAESSRCVILNYAKKTNEDEDTGTRSIFKNNLVKLIKYYFLMVEACNNDY